jgi:histidyl-tRNA synthetase
LLVDYFSAHADELDADSQRRLHTNPLRILDSKNPAMQALIEGAPRLLDQLGGTTRAHFDGLQRLLSDTGIAFTVNARLVRGLDYYNRTVFEWMTDKLGAQGTVGGGGRYDGLFSQLGGKPTPACGFAIGVERILMLMQDAARGVDDAPDAYVVHVGDRATRMAMSVAENLRDAGLEIVVHAGGGNFGSQMRRADASGARYALIVGDDEAAANVVAVKPLRDTGAQMSMSPEELAKRIAPAPRAAKHL